MSESAQRPPNSGSVLERLRDLGTELLLLCLSAVAGMTVVLALTFVGALPTDAAWSAILSGPILIGTTAASYLALERPMSDGKPPAIPTLAGRDRATIGVGLVIATVAVVIATTGSVLIGLLQKVVFSAEVEEQQTIVNLVQRGDPFELTLLAVSAVILAPLAEELLFRHMLFRRLHAQVGVIAAWTIPALAFGLSHGNLVGLAIYAWLGTVFALAYAFSGRLWVAILVHAGHNAFALTMLLNAPEVLP